MTKIKSYDAMVDAENGATENTRMGQDISWFEEDKWTLSKRVDQIETGVHWTEESRSRVCHMISNVQLVDASPSVDDAEELTVRSRFLLYQNRVEYESNFFVGKRTDKIRWSNAAGSDTAGAWKLARREIILDQMCCWRKI